MSFSIKDFKEKGISGSFGVFCSLPRILINLAPVSHTMSLWTMLTLSNNQLVFQGTLEDPWLMKTLCAQSLNSWLTCIWKVSEYLLIFHRKFTEETRLSLNVHTCCRFECARLGTAPLGSLTHRVILKNCSSVEIWCSGVLVPFHHLLVTKELHLPFGMYSTIKFHDKIATTLANSSESSEVKTLYSLTVWQEL